MSSLADLARRFAEPPLDYSPIPFWFLNGDLEPSELRRQLRLMRSIGIGTVVLHARKGRAVEYLSQEWFDAIRVCVDECAELQMKAWLYDEDNWPSGYAGGEVLKRYPRGQAKCLARVGSEPSEGVPVATVGGQSFVRQLTPWHPAYSEGWYTDLMDLKATQTFLETTHERYAEALGDHLGTTVTAVFTDEPGFYNHFHDCAPGTIPWTEDLPAEFERRAGYGLLDYLPALFEDCGGSELVRVDFYRVVSQLICERYYRPLREWCQAHGLRSVGHVNNEEYLVDHVRYNADFFSAMDGLDVPGIDIIGPEADWHRRPDSFIPKLAASAAHTRGKNQVISETYGASGWGLSPEEMRRLADWQSVRGVTRLVPHAFYYSVEGFRYKECPPSLFFQSPHWPYIPALVRYLTRWTWLLENTQPVGEVAVYYPIDAVRAVTTPEVPRSLGNGLVEEEAGEAGRLGLAFRELTDRLFRAKVDFEVVDDTALMAAEIKDGGLALAGRCFRCLVLPPGEMSDAAEGLVTQAIQAGVTVLEGSTEGVVADASSWACLTLDPPCAQVTATRRVTENGDVFLIVKEGEDNYEGTVLLPVKGEVTQWDLGSGQVDAWQAEQTEEGTRLRLFLLAGSAVCFGVQRG